MFSNLDWIRTSVLHTEITAYTSGESLVNSETDKHVEIKVEVTEIPIVAASPKKCLKTQGYLSRRRPVSEEERSKAWEAANSFTSNFPYTVVCLSALHVYKASPTVVSGMFDCHWLN